MLVFLWQKLKTWPRFIDICWISDKSACCIASKLNDIWILDQKIQKHKKILSGPAFLILVIFLWLIFYSLQRKFALPCRHHACIWKNKRVSNLGLLFCARMDIISMLKKGKERKECWNIVQKLCVHTIKVLYAACCKKSTSILLFSSKIKSPVLAPLSTGTGRHTSTYTNYCCHPHTSTHIWPNSNPKSWF